MRKLTHIILLTALVADPWPRSEQSYSTFNNMSCSTCAPIVKKSLMRIEGHQRREAALELRRLRERGPLSRRPFV